MKFLYTILFLVGTVALSAQEDVPKADSLVPEATISVEKDLRVDELMDKKISIAKVVSNKETFTGKTVLVKKDKEGRANVPGFRIQVMNTTDRAAVYAMKGKLYQIYPNHKQYVVAQAPFFKLRFGNFTTRVEAEKYRKALSPMFPNGVYIVSDIIETRIRRESVPTPGAVDTPKKDEKAKKESSAKKDANKKTKA
jgi:hypothetical protein